jgi:hypothetical protein
MTSVSLEESLIVGNQMTNDQALMTNDLWFPIGHWDLVIGHLHYQSVAPFGARLYNG